MIEMKCRCSLCKTILTDHSDLVMMIHLAKYHEQMYKDIASRVMNKKLLKEVSLALKR